MVPGVLNIIEVIIFVRFWVDGPGDIAGACPLGSRLISPCSHVMAVLFLGCLLSHDPQAFKSKHTTMNLIDRGNKLPQQHLQVRFIFIS